MEQLSLLWANLMGLGRTRLMALGLVFALVVGALGLSAYLMSRPNLETLYAGLDREDVSRIGPVLTSAGIAFDVNPEGNIVSVQAGATARARMLLAERGLPQSANTGYELYDKIGALGLTSFMQEVTRVRALEGELARTIQLMRGVKAARVHIVMPDEGSFRRAKQSPSASVVIRTEGPDDSSASSAIRHLVAASLPGMTVDQVTVLNTDGMILSSSDGDQTDAVPAKTLLMEKSIAKDIQDNIRRTLTPYLRLSNFQVSVRARINTDKRQINETTYDPESKVERSVRTVKETAASQNNASSPATSVERNIPQDRPPPTDAKQTNEESRKNEELKNFELSTKTMTTTTGGYNIENISVAILVNRGAFSSVEKADAKPEALERKIKEIEDLVSSAAGIKKDRGDTIKVAAVDFMFNENEMAPVESRGFMDMIQRNFGSLINAVTLLVITGLIAAFGLGPATKALLAPPSENLETSPLIGAESPIEYALPNDATAALPFPESQPFDPSRVLKESARQRLEELIAADELHAALVLKGWMRSEQTT